MAKALIITEKPSVARDIVAALGGFVGSSKQGYWENEQYVCTFALGHLLEFLAPEDLDPSYKQWSLQHLPIVPERFALKPIKDHAERLSAIRSLAQRSDVTRLINACDAAREGELIFREITAYFGLRQPVERLWLQSMTPEAIRASFARLRPGEQVRGLAEAAACRAKSDWLIGMNATRAFSKRLSRPGDAAAWSVGRVQTPTLALLVERELAILAHDPKPFYQIKAEFIAEDHRYEGVWFAPPAGKAGDSSLSAQLPEDEAKSGSESAAAPANESRPRDDRISDIKVAQTIIASLPAGSDGHATETRDQSRRTAPPPFDLTALQKQMANRYKWTSKRTLEAAQRCYETHKVITYPRTGSHCLPSDYEPQVMRLLHRFAEQTPFAEHAQTLLRTGLHNREKIFDDAGVTDHFAIVPTGKLASLTGDDLKVFEAIVQRFLAAFFPPAVFARVRRVTTVSGHAFRTGPIETLLEPGWMAVADSPRKTTVKPLLPLSTPAVKLASAKLLQDQTKPPPRISEAGLLSLMEHAGRQVDDVGLRAALNRAEGLGTPATRADIIQNLKSKAYIDHELRPTFKGVQLIQILQRIGVARLTSAELTARLELELAEVEAGQRPSSAFMASVVQYISDVVAAAKSFHIDQLYADLAPLGPCPQCKNGSIHEQSWRYACVCGFSISKEIGSRYLDRKSVVSLLQQGETAVIDGLVSPDKDANGRIGKARPGALAIRQGQVVLQTMDAAGGLLEQALPSPTLQPTKHTAARKTLGDCPIHPQDCHVIETRAAWLCTTRLQQLQAGAADPIGTFLPKLVCGRPLSTDDAKAFIERGTTTELQGFQSRKGHSFAARIVMRPGGAWAFAFAPSSSKEKPAQSPNHA